MSVTREDRSARINVESGITSYVCWVRFGSDVDDCANLLNRSFEVLYFVSQFEVLLSGNVQIFVPIRNSTFHIPHIHSMEYLGQNFKQKPRTHAHSHLCTIHTYVDS